MDSDRLGELSRKLEEVRDELRNMAEAERTAFEDLSDRQQESEKGEKMEERADLLDEAADTVDSAVEGLLEVVEV